jgi:small subunit ribosomal protein S15
VALSKQTKQEYIQKFAKNPSDTGSAEVQTALLTGRISQLTEHLQTHRKDFHTRRGLHVIVGQRRRLLQYLRRTNPRRYQQIIQELNIRGV